MKIRIKKSFTVLFIILICVPYNEINSKNISTNDSKIKNEDIQQEITKFASFNPNFGIISDMIIIDDLILLAAQGLIILNISDIKNPKFVTRINEKITYLCIDYNNSLLALGSNDLFDLFNISNIINPFFITRYQYPGEYTDIIIERNILWCIRNNHFIECFKFMNSEIIRETSRYVNYIQTLFLFKKYILAPTRDYGIYFLNLTTFQVERIFYPDISILDFCFEENLGYIISFTTINVINMTNIYEITTLKSISLNYLSNVQIKSDICFLNRIIYPSTISTITILNMTNLNNISEISQYNTTIAGIDLIVGGDFCVLFAENIGLEIIN
ncbi:MAG: hypothetical protein ACFFDW_15605, partial [Candidatus Thorarchaeota archaeon]